MQKTIEKQLKRLEDEMPFEYTFKELDIKFNNKSRAFDLKFIVNFFVVHVHIIYLPDYPFSAPHMLFINLNAAIKHPFLKVDKTVNMCDFSPAIDIKQQIVNCYLIFLEMLNNPENEDLVELGEVIFPMLEEEEESFNNNVFGEQLQNEVSEARNKVHGFQQIDIERKTPDISL